MNGEIRGELGRLDKVEVKNGAWEAITGVVVQHADEMIYKETSILFPICTMNFMGDEQKQIYRDSKNYENCLGVASKVYETAEGGKPAAKEKGVQAATNTAEIKYYSSSFVGGIVMSGGHLKLNQLERLLNTVPMEITFVDVDNINRYFNESKGQKTFKRPKMASNREVFSCHPPKVEPPMRQVIGEFRTRWQNSVPIQAEKGGKTMLVNYRVVRDAEDNYLGITGFVQDMEPTKRHFQQGGEKQSD